MGRAWISGLAFSLAAGLALPQSHDAGVRDSGAASSRMVLGGGNPLLASGSEAIRYGSYREGIRLTQLGLERAGNTERDKAGALSNICAAYAALGEPDSAIEHCDMSLSIDSGNWRAFSNRAYAYWLKGMYVEARYDVDAAIAISPKARQALEITGLINEAVLRPRVSTEDHQ